MPAAGEECSFRQRHDRSGRLSMASLHTQALEIRTSTTHHSVLGALQLIRTLVWEVTLYQHVVEAPPALSLKRLINVLESPTRPTWPCAYCPIHPPNCLGLLLPRSL